MYCKKCRAQIDEDSVYCSQCGTDQTKNAPPSIPEDVSRKANIEKETKESSIGCLPCLLFCILSIAIILGCIYFSNQKEDSTKENSVGSAISDITHRAVRQGDLEIREELDLSNLAANIVIHPNCDIQDLEITLEFYDNKGNIVKKKVEKIGNTKESIEIKKQISILDLAASEILKIKSCSVYVTDGKVSVFA